MTKRRTARPVETVVWEQDGKRVIRDTDAHEYRSYVYGVEVGAGYPTAHEAEQAANAAMYALLNGKAA